MTIFFSFHLQNLPCLFSKHACMWNCKLGIWFHGFLVNCPTTGVHDLPHCSPLNPSHDSNAFVACCSIPPSHLHISLSSTSVCRAMTPRQPLQTSSVTRHQPCRRCQPKPTYIIFLFFICSHKKIYFPKNEIDERMRTTMRITTTISNQQDRDDDRQVKNNIFLKNKTSALIMKKEQ